MNKFLEMLKKALTDNKETEKVDFAVLTTGFNEAIAESNAGVTANKNTILTEKKKLQDKFEALEAKFKDVDADEFKRLVEEEEERKIRGDDDSGDVDERIKTLTKEFTEFKIESNKIAKRQEAAIKEKTEELETITTSSEDYKTRLFGSQKETALNTAFDAHNIKPEHRGILKDAFKSKTSVELDDEGNLVVSVVGDDNLPLPIVDYFKSWSVTDAAKPYIGAKANNGGGANGSNGGDGGDGEIITTKEAYDSEFK